MQYLCKMGKLLHGDATCKSNEIALSFISALFFVFISIFISEWKSYGTPLPMQR